MNSDITLAGGGENEHELSYFRGQAWKQHMLPPLTFHWPEFSHVGPLTALKAGKCSLPRYQGGKENRFGEGISEPFKKDLYGGLGGGGGRV